MNKLLQFIKEARAELRKVNWPTRAQTVKFTGAVVGVSLAVAIFLGSLDYLFEYISRTFIVK
ncbi:MAG: preprotein translocase subunit SecE [Patescibacteria group bacterium]|nr:preprotein translocase subunit SecE [Patescibacteria group bacterium]